MVRTQHPRQDGFTLVEVTVTISILSIGLLALAGSLGSMIELGDDRLVETWKPVQLQNVRNAIETVDFELISFVFGPGAGNEKFWCDDSGQVWFFDPGNSAATGSIIVFDDESLVPLSFANEPGGIDLNANGVIDVGSITDYEILPVRIEINYPNNPGMPTEVGEYFLRP